MSSAQQGKNTKHEILFNYASYTGLKKVIQENTIGGFFTFKNHSKNTTGFYLNSRQTGEFIRTNRFHISHNYFIIKEEELKISTSVQLGGIEYTVVSDGLVEGGTDWGLDGGFSVWYQQKKLGLGFTISHLFNTKLAPLQENIELKKKYNFIGNYLLNFSNNFKYHPTLLFQYQENFHSHLYNKFIFYENYLINIGYFNNQGISWGVGIQKIDIQQFEISFFANYFSKIRLQSLFSNRYEFTFVLGKR